MDPRTASLGVKSSKRNRELENSASLGPRVCEVLLYFDLTSEQNYLVFSNKQDLPFQIGA